MRKYNISVLYTDVNFIVHVHVEICQQLIKRNRGNREHIIIEIAVQGENHTRLKRSHDYKSITNYIMIS